MTKEWKGSAKPTISIPHMTVEAPAWMVAVAWFGLGLNVAGFIMNSIVGSVGWALLGFVGALWLGYWLWSYYQTRKA